MRLTNSFKKIAATAAAAVALHAMAAATYTPLLDTTLNDFDPTIKLGRYVQGISSNTVNEVVILTNGILTVNGESINISEPSEALEPLLFTQYYPDGSVKSAEEFTAGIKYYDPDTTNRTITVRPFCNSGESGDDNSSLVGRVVIPPFVDGDGNGYISDDGTRYKVVGVSGGGSFGSNANLTAIVAPSTVTTIGNYVFDACLSLTTVSLPAVTNTKFAVFSYCPSLTTVSLPAATDIGDAAFYNSTSLASVDFGVTPRSSVPTLGSGAFYNVPTSCIIIVPDAQYDDWTAATIPDPEHEGETLPNPWYDLVQAGYKFLRHSEWGYAHSYEVNGKLDSMERIAWSALKAKRDGSLLVPGQQYRITNYVATVANDTDAQSADHPFDIIVPADDEHTLNEHARAVIHEDDTYFASCDLAAWDVWYCLDNNTNRFEWADSTNGKGIIYRLVDEFRNDCPYDFKGIQFRRWAITGITNPDFTDTALGSLSNEFVYAKNGEKCFAYSSSNISVNNMVMAVDYNTSAWYFTFDTGAGADNSKGGYSSEVFDNTIAAYASGAKTKLNNIVFLGNKCYSNTFGNNCYHNTFGYLCRDNTFGSNCYTNIFGGYCYHNTFGSGCYRNIFGNSCFSNTFSDYCNRNIFGRDCRYNTFGSGCNSNTFRNFCRYNTFGMSCGNNIITDRYTYNTLGDLCTYNTFAFQCEYNTFGNSCEYNTFGEYCKYNTFGNDCGHNTFGNRCNSNTFGNNCEYNTFNYTSCEYNTFGNNCHHNTLSIYCYSNTFGSSCGYIRFGNASYIKPYCRYIRVASGNQYIYINPTGTTSDSSYYQNVEIKEGVNNTTTYKTIDDPNVGQTFHTTYKPINSQEISL